MSEETEVAEEVTEEVSEGATEETTDETVTEEGDKETKTLLSDDEGDGAGDVPVEYEFISPDDIGEV